MNTSKPTSLQSILKDRQREAFVGREEFLSLFNKNLGLPLNDVGRRFIYVLSGQGGVGKSSLLRRFRQLAEGADGIIGWVDESDLDVPAVMGRIAEQFESMGHELKFFNARYRVYREKRQQLEADPEAPQGFPALVGRTVAKGGLRLARSVPMGGMIVDLVDEETVATLMGDVSTYIARKLTNKDEVHLLLDPIDVLTPLFLKDLHKIADKNLIALFFDTYERTSHYLDLWLRNIVDGQFGEVPSNILISIAGQYDLDRNHWAPYEGILAHLRLELFSEEEAREYLRLRGFIDEEIIETIIHLSGRLPLLLATLAIEVPQSINQIGEPSDTAVKRFLKWVDDIQKREIALNAALIRKIDKDVLSVIAPKDNIDSLFEWLKEMPFVIKRVDGWIYHNVVREQMLRHKIRETHQGWVEIHGMLVEYYEKLQNNLNLSSKKRLREPTYQNYILESLYHKICQAPNATISSAINGFVEAFVAQRAFARRWAETIEQAGIDTENQDVQIWGSELLNGIKAHDDDDDQKSIVLFDKLLRSDLVDVKLHHFLHYQRTLIYFSMKEWDKALIDSTIAIKLNPKNGEYWRIRGKIYINLEMYNESLKDINQSIKINPKLARAFVDRGEVNRVLTNYDEAIRDINQALNLQPELRHVAQKELGSIYYFIGKYQDAAICFIKSLEEDARCSGCWDMLTQTYQSLYTDKNLAKMLRKVDLSTKMTPEIITCRASALMDIGLYKDALIDLNDAIFMDDKYIAAIAYRGILYSQIGKNSDALIDLNKAISIDNRKPWLYKIRAQVLVNLDLHDQAIIDLKNFIELDSSNEHEGYKKIGAIYESLGKNEEAIKALRKSLEAQFACDGCWKSLVKAYKNTYHNCDIAKLIKDIPIPETNNSRIIACRSSALASIGYIKESLDDLDYIIERGEADNWLFSFRAEIYEEEGRYEEAISDLDHLLIADPSSASSVYTNKGLLFTYLGRYEEAVDMYNKVLSMDLDDYSNLYNIAIAVTVWKGLSNSQTHIDKAYEVLQDLIDTEQHAIGIYGLAGLSAVQGLHSDALLMLEQALDMDPKIIRWARKDVAWLELRNNEKFKEIVDKYVL